MWYEEKSLYFDFCKILGLNENSFDSLKRYRESDIHLCFSKIKQSKIGG